ncbi:hypothetical protein ACS0TY_016686 [Phlomoides rotata]
MLKSLLPWFVCRYLILLVGKILVQENLFNFKFLSLFTLLIKEVCSLNFSSTSNSSTMTSSGAEIINGDKLVLRGLKFHGFHGVKPEEQKLGQKFLIDVDAWTDLQAAGISDHLQDTISYTAIYSIVRDVVEGAPHNLLESVAERIASTVLSKYTQISAVRIKVGKPHVAVLGSVDYLGVEITRHRSSVVQS